MKTCTFLLEITKQGAQSLRMKMRNAELNLKGATVIYGLQMLAARLPELTKKLEILNCSHWFYSEENIRTRFELTTRRFTSLR